MYQYIDTSPVANKDIVVAWTVSHCGSHHSLFYGDHANMGRDNNGDGTKNTRRDGKKTRDLSQWQRSGKALPLEPRPIFWGYHHGARDTSKPQHY